MRRDTRYDSHRRIQGFKAAAGTFFASLALNGVAWVIIEASERSRVDSGQSPPEYLTDLQGGRWITFAVALVVAVVVGVRVAKEIRPDGTVKDWAGCVGWPLVGGLVPFFLIFVSRAS